MDINKDPTPRTLPAGVCDLTLTAVFKRKENFLYVWDKRMKPPSDHKDRKGVRIWCQALLAPKPEFFSLHQTEIWVIVFLPSLWVDMSGQRVPTDSHWGEETQGFGQARGSIKAGCLACSAPTLGVTSLIFSSDLQCTLDENPRDHLQKLCPLRASCLHVLFTGEKLEKYQLLNLLNAHALTVNLYHNAS